MPNTKSLYLFHLVLFNCLYICQAAPRLDALKKLYPRAYTVGLNGRWPHGKINYCFMGANENAMEDIFDAAWGIWAQFNDFPMKKTRLDSCDEDYYSSEGLQRQDVLYVIQQNGGHPSSSVGRKSKNELKFDPGFSGASGNIAASIVHELGHVFGLLHEHQKPGADRHIEYKCKNLADFDEKTKGKSKQQVNAMCSSQAAAEATTFSAEDILPYRGLDANYYQEDREMNAPDYIDWDSIMIYGSRFGGRQQSKMPWDKKEPGRKVVMLKKDGSEIRNNMLPSRRDIERLKALYSQPFPEMFELGDISEFVNPNPPTA